MKVKETDLRVKKTKASIKNALFDLIEVHGFETITVKELTTKAKINRGTFYLHYENIDDLIDEYYSDFISKLYALFEMKEEDLIKEAGWYYPIVEPVSPFIVSILLFIKKNNKLFDFLWITHENRYYKRKLKLCIRDILFYNEKALINKDDLLVPESYFTSYVISAFMGVVRQWLDRDCKESPEEIARILSFLNHKGVLVSAGAQDMENNCQKGEAVMNNQSNTYYIYESFEQEFKQNLNRKLTEKEKSFLEWLSQKVSDDMPPSK